MRKSTKGALAGLSAVALLLGGFGTHAGWTGTGTVSGGTFKSGYLRLGGATCSGWKLGDGTLWNSLSDPLMIPGTLLKEHCTFTVEADGYGLSAKLTVDSPTFSSSNGLTSALDVQGAYTDGDGNALSFPATLTNNEEIDADLTVQLPAAVTGTAAQDLTAVLDDVTVTASQV